MKKSAKKACSLLLAVLMCFSVFVLDWSGLIQLAPTAQAITSQDAGNYSFTVTFKIDKNGTNNHNSGWGQTTEDTFIIAARTKKNNGRNSATYTYDYWGSTGSKTWSGGGKQDYDGGFPDGFYMMGNDNSVFQGVKANITKIVVSGRTVWTGTMHIDSTTNEYHTYVYAPGQGTDGGNDSSYGYTKTTTKDWPMPKPTVTFNGSTSVTTDGTTQKTYSIKSAVDQYGVKWGFSSVTWASSNSTLAPIDNNGVATFGDNNGKAYDVTFTPTLVHSSGNYTSDQSITVHVTPSIETLSLNTAKTAAIVKPGFSRAYYFTPSTSGKYVFFTYGDSSTGDTRIYINKVNSSASNNLGDEVGYNDDYGHNTTNTNGTKVRDLIGTVNNQSYTAIDLEANTKYVVRVNYYYSNANNVGNIPLKVCKGVNITFNGTGGLTSNASTFEAIMPAGHTMKMNQSGFTRNNHDMIAWSTTGTGAEGKSCMATATITIPSSNTKYFALWYPTSPAALTVNSANNTATISYPSQIHYYKFTPTESRKYLIYSTNADSYLDPYLIVYNAATYQTAATYLKTDDDGGNSHHDFVGDLDRNFYLEYALQANTTYLLGVKLYDAEDTTSRNCTGSYGFNFEAIYDVTYNAGNGSGAPEAQNKYYNRDLALSTVAPSPSASDAAAGLGFIYWKDNASGTIYNPNLDGYKYTENADVTLTAVYGKQAKANYYWYDASGAQQSSDEGSYIYNATDNFTFNFPAVPASFTVDGSTYVFQGWAKDDVTKTSTDYNANAQNATFDNTLSEVSFYAVYKKTVKLTYNANGGSAAPAQQTKVLYLNCGNNANVKRNANDSWTFTLNPDNVAMTRAYASDFLGWNEDQNDANVNEHAVYKDGTVTAESSADLPLTITVRKDNTTLFAVYYEYRYKVRFVNPEGNLLAPEQTVRYNTSATAPVGLSEDPSDPTHTDSVNHYVFDHWEYTNPDDGTVYTDSDVLNKNQYPYTYVISARYLGHSHIWGEPFDERGATTCLGGKQYKVRCTVCGEVYIMEEAPLSHVFDEVTGVAEPTCTKNGSWGKRVCSLCGTPDPTYKVDTDDDGIEDLLVTDENRIRPALGHQYGIEALEKDGDGNYILKDGNGEFFVSPLTVNATCTTSGYYYYECARCGDQFRVGNIPAAGHVWEEDDEVAATCTEPGHSAYKYCSVCELVITQRVDTPALGHDYVLVEETDSTCQVKGHDAYYQCSRCGKYFDVDDDRTEIEDISVKDKELGEHDYQLTTQDPTCTEPGYTDSYVCTFCGQVDPERAGSVVGALGHDLPDTWTEVTPATCADPGEEKRECSRCDYVETREIPALEHAQGEYIAPADPTCTEDGHTEGYKCLNCDGYFTEPTVIAKLGHAMETVKGTAPTCTVPGTPDYRHCTRCGKYFADAAGRRELTMTEDGEGHPVPAEGQLAPIDALGHDWTDFILAKAPTCTEAGKETHKCMRCGTVENNDVPAIGHDYTPVEAKAETCLEDGNIAYYECANCGKCFLLEDETYVEASYEDDILIPAPGHDLPAEPTAQQAATCAADGYEDYECARCHRTVREILPRTNEHPADSIEEFGARAATCTQVGYNPGTRCTVCSTVLTYPTATPKAAHTPADERVGKVDATCQATGYTGDLYCSVCGQMIESGTVIGLADHSLGDLILVRAATCTEKGEKRRECALCDYYVTYETPVLGHQIVKDKGTPATCTEDGLTDGTHCSRCNTVFVEQTVIEAIGHNYKSEVVAPTCTQVGYTLSTCVNCGDSYKDNYTDKVPHTVRTPATCTEAAVCGVCGRSYGDPLGHEYVLNYTNLGTCVSRGVNAYICTRCGDTYNEELDFGTHSFDEATAVIVEATCTANGSVTRTCVYCGEEVVEVIPAEGHHYENGVCTRCGEPESTTPDTPSQPSGSDKCSKCGLNHNGRTGLWKEDGFFCKLISFFRNLFKFAR